MDLSLAESHPDSVRGQRDSARCLADQSALEQGASEQCLSDEQVLAFSEGSLAPAAMDSVNAHLDWCPTCQELVNAAVHDWDHPPASVADRIWMATFGPRQMIAGRYRIERFLGRGGMGEVYAAFDTVLGEHVALKTVLSTTSDNPSAVKRLFSEARLARRVHHRNVCRVHDVGVHEEPGRIDERLHFLTMELIEGKRLAQLLRAGPLSVQLACNIARQVLLGLQAAHEAGVLHRDLKSDNIMVTGPAAAGSDRDVRISITDFGLAQALDVDGRALGGGRQERVGSLAYMAPEQILGQDLTLATDLFGFGVVFFEMLCGRLPFVVEGESARELAQRRLSGHVPALCQLRAGVPAALEAVVLRCLQTERAARFGSASEALAALDLVILDSAALDSAALDSAALDSAALDSAALDSAATEVAQQGPAQRGNAQRAAQPPQS